MSDEFSAETGAEEFPGVCVVTHPLAAAGENATRSLLEIIGALTAVTLVTADLPEESVIRDRHPVVELTDKGSGDSIPVAATRFLLNQLRMCAVLTGRDEEVVLFYGATSYVLPVAVARLLGKRVLVEPRGDVPLTLRLNWEQRVPKPVAQLLAGTVRLLERTGFWLADGVVTYTPSMATQLGLDPAKSSVYPTGARYVQTDTFDITTPYEKRGQRVGFLGRLDEEKNVRELAAVAKRLAPEITFAFIGDGDLRDWLEDELEQEIGAGDVEMRGWVNHDDVPDELNRLRLVVLPSEPTEGLPTTILESLACGTPVCASPVAGVPDVITDGETGFLLDQTDAEPLCRRIVSTLDRDDLSDISSRGRARIEAEYSFEAAKNRYAEIFRTVSKQ